MRDALLQGVALGQGPAAIARAVRGALGGNLARALTICRTETLRAYREASRRSYEANADVVDGWVWNCACTARSCAMCWAMHGSVHPLTERLDDHPNGRCSMLPHVKALPGLGAQALPESGPAQFARLEPAAQDAIVGRATGRAYRAGAIRLEDVVGRTFDPDWGPGRRVKSLREIVGAAEARKWSQAARVAAASKTKTAELTFRSIAEAEKWARKTAAEMVGFSQAPDVQSVKTVCQVAREFQEQYGLQKLDSLRFSAAKKLEDNGQCGFVTEAGRVYSSGDVVIGGQSDTTRGLVRLQEGRRIAEEVIAQHGHTTFRDDILARYAEQIKAVHEGRFDAYGVHSKYAFRDPYEAAARHELAHAWHGQHADVIKSKLGFGYAESVPFEVLRRYGVTVRALDSWNECVAENFVLYSAGKTDRIHPDLLDLFKELTV